MNIKMKISLLRKRHLNGEQTPITLKTVKMPNFHAMMTPRFYVTHCNDTHNIADITW